MRNIYARRLNLTVCNIITYLQGIVKGFLPVLDLSAKKLGFSGFTEKLNRLFLISPFKNN